MRIALSTDHIKEKWRHIEDPGSCLAKTEVDSDSGLHIPGMTVYQHCMACGLVAEELRKVFPYLDSIGLFPPGYDLIAAMHDIGKISPAFQQRIIRNLVDCTDYAERFGLMDSSISHDVPHHSSISYAALYDRFGKEVAYIEGSHHGWLMDNNVSTHDFFLGGKEWQNARMEVVSRLEAFFGTGLPKGLTDYQVAFLSGLTIVSDWISSAVSLADYNREASVVFGRKVADSGFHVHRYRNGLSFHDVFGFEPRSEQKIFIDHVKEPGVYVLEASTGSGKTEAALYAAYKILEAGKAEGIYFALPTRLTSREIHKRFEKFLRVILADSDKTSAKLVFGQSMLYNCVFTDSFSARDWFDSRKRLMLAPFGVGTVDQALMSVISVKHSTVRAFALAGKVVIIDEVHSYDSYTSRLIARLIDELRNLGATVIILSATLQSDAKRSLLGLPGNIDIGESYPSVTSLNGHGLDAIPMPAEKDIHVELIQSDDEVCSLDCAIDDAISGKYVIWVENTVAEAQRIFAIARSRCAGQAGTGLIHSRFTSADRTAKEEQYVGMFGKGGWKMRCASHFGFLLVGTQILEQSLDIDADVLYTRIAPADMIFQRIGRLWRHSHPERMGNPICHIIRPNSSDVVHNPHVLGASGSVYEQYVLYRTILVLGHCQSLHLPADIRPVLERVYAESSPDEESNPNTRSMKRTLIERKNRMESLARSAQLHIGQPFSESAVTRYSELRSCRVLLLQHLDVDERVVHLPSGERIALKECRTAEERSAVSMRLEAYIFPVTESQIPKDLAKDKGVIDMLSGFVYSGEKDGEDQLLVMLESEDKYLTDVYGNKLKACYTVSMGYYLEEKGGTYGK